MKGNEDVSLRALALAAAIAARSRLRGHRRPDRQIHPAHDRLAGTASAAYLAGVDRQARARDTPSGSFKAVPHGEGSLSRRNGTTRRCPIPFSSPRTGHAIHGSFDVKNARHAGVRRLRAALAPENAAILFNLVKADGVLNTQVVLTGTEPAASQQMSLPRRRARIRNRKSAIPMRAAAGEDQNFIARGAPNNGIDAQLYGGQRLRQRRPCAISSARRPTTSATRDGTYPPRYQQQPVWPTAAALLRRGNIIAAAQPYYGSRYRDPYYDNRRPPDYRRGY